MLDIQSFSSSVATSRSMMHSGTLTYCAAKIGGPNHPIWCSVVVQQDPTMVEFHSASASAGGKKASATVARKWHFSNMTDPRGTDTCHLSYKITFILHMSRPVRDSREDFCPTTSCHQINWRSTIAETVQFLCDFLLFCWPFAAKTKQSTTTKPVPKWFKISALLFRPGTDSYLLRCLVSTIWQLLSAFLYSVFLLHTPMRITTAAGTFCSSSNPPSLSSSLLRPRPLPVKYFGVAVEAHGQEVAQPADLSECSGMAMNSVLYLPVNRNDTPNKADLQTCHICFISRLIRATKPSENTVILAVVPQK